MEEFGEPTLTPVDNTNITITAPFGNGPGFMEIPSYPMNPAPAIGGFPDYGSWQIPTPGPDGAVPVPGSGIVSIGRSGNPSIDGQQPGVVEFDGPNAIPNYDDDGGYSGGSGGGARKDGCKTDKTCFARSPEGWGLAYYTEGGHQFDFLKGVFEKHVSSSDDLPPISIDGLSHKQVGDLQATAYLLATGQTLTLDAYKKDLDGVIQSRLNWENLLTNAGRPHDAQALAKDKWSLPFFVNQLNQVFEKEGWPVRVKMNPIKDGDQNIAGILQVDKVDRNGNPTGPSWAHRIDMPKEEPKKK